MSYACARVCTCAPARVFAGARCCENTASPDRDVSVTGKRGGVTLAVDRRRRGGEEGGGEGGRGGGGRRAGCRINRSSVCFLSFIYTHTKQQKEAEPHISTDKGLCVCVLCVCACALCVHARVCVLMLTCLMKS